MTELRIRNVDEWIVDIHRHNAKKNGTSLESEIKRESKKGTQLHWRRLFVFTSYLSAERVAT